MPSQLTLIQRALPRFILVVALTLTVLTTFNASTSVGATEFLDLAQSMRNPSIPVPPPRSPQERKKFEVELETAVARAFDPIFQHGYTKNSLELAAAFENHFSFERSKQLLQLKTESEKIQAADRDEPAKPKTTAFWNGPKGVRRADCVDASKSAKDKIRCILEATLKDVPGLKILKPGVTHPEGTLRTEALVMFNGKKMRVAYLLGDTAVTFGPSPDSANVSTPQLARLPATLFGSALILETHATVVDRSKMQTLLDRFDSSFSVFGDADPERVNSVVERITSNFESKFPPPTSKTDGATFKSTR